MSPPPPRQAANRKRTEPSSRATDAAADAPTSEASAPVDVDAVRQACDPIGRWWERTQTTGRADPARLARAVSRARLLGPLPGPLGAALAYILAGCPDLDYPRVRAAFDRVAEACRSGGPTPADFGQPSGVARPVQLRFDDLLRPADGPVQPERR